MSEYTVFSDCGTFDAPLFYNIAEALEFREEILTRDGQHLADFVHVGLLTFVPLSSPTGVEPEPDHDEWARDQRERSQPDFGRQLT